MKLDELFEINVAKSKGVEDYDAGNVPFITNTEINNGIVKYVEPLEDDRVFLGPAINISGLGFATLQLGSFLPKGNGGDACAVLIPIEEMELEELIYYVAIFNLEHKWRFSFGRKTTKGRLERLALVPSYANYDKSFESKKISEDMQMKITSFQGQINYLD